MSISQHSGHSAHLLQPVGQNMLSSSNHQYPSPFIHRPSGNTPAPTEPMMQQRSPMAGLDALATGSQYALQQMQQNADNTSQKQKQRSSSDATHGNLTQDQSASALAQKPVGGRSTGGPVRRRISRACDQCNQLRTKCDGQKRIVLPPCLLNGAR